MLQCKGSATELGAGRLIEICIACESLKPYEIGTKKLLNLVSQLESIFANTIAAFNNATITVQNNQHKKVYTDC
jgi:hypothetical protein